jgi:hypothetical protein
MNYVNDNICECGHPKILHFVDNKFVTKACTLNQKQCDCWGFKLRRVEHREYVDLHIHNSK